MPSEFIGINGIERASVDSDEILLKQKNNSKLAPVIIRSGKVFRTCPFKLAMQQNLACTGSLFLSHDQRGVFNLERQHMAL
jgi:hypothetical protein